jgi:hypothetical protein
MILAFAGDRIIAHFNIPRHPILDKIMASKMLYSMGAWYLGGMLKSAVTQTDAFEVFFDGAPLFSRLQSQPPTFPDTQQLVDVVSGMLGGE